MEFHQDLGTALGEVLTRTTFHPVLVPKVVQARCAEMASKDNMFGQLTVRMHTQQTLAVYDRFVSVRFRILQLYSPRFGRLIHGSETVAKDVLEFVVFEKHLSNT